MLQGSSGLCAASTGPMLQSPSATKEATVTRSPWTQQWTWTEPLHMTSLRVLLPLLHSWPHPPVAHPAGPGSISRCLIPALPWRNGLRDRTCPESRRKLQEARHQPGHGDSSRRVWREVFLCAPAPKTPGCLLSSPGVLSTFSLSFPSSSIY